MSKTIYLVLADTPNGRKKYLPFGALYLGNSLKKAGYNVVVRHCIEKEFDGVISEICNNKPLFVGLSVITGTHVSYAIKVSKSIKEKDSSIPIIWGGVHPSLLGDQCLQEDYIDFVINGEGEETIVEFADQLKGKKNFSKVMGLGYKENGKIHSAERRFISDLSKARIDFSLVNINDYFLDFPEGQERVLTYLTSRGCPYRCGFCYNLNYNKRKWRPFPMEIIKEDIDFLKKNYNIDGIKFCDDNFVVDKKRCLEILSYLDLPSTFDMRMDSITDEFLKELRRLKVLEFLIGFETGSEETQELIKKDYTVKQGIGAVRLLAKYHFRCHYAFVLGLPGETYESVRKTVKLIWYISKRHKEATFSPGQYLPYPGTPLYINAIEMGFQVPKTTAGWEVFDRWTNKMEIPWAPIDTDFCYYVKWYSFFIAARVGIISSICRWRLKHMNFAFPIDLKLFLFLYNTAYFSNSVFGKFIKNFAKLFQFKLKSTVD